MGSDGTIEADPAAARELHHDALAACPVHAKGTRPSDEHLEGSCSTAPRTEDGERG